MIPRGSVPPWRGGLLYGIAGVCVLSSVLYYRQNVAGQVGGPISVEKILWLNYTIIAWFVIPFGLLCQSGLDRALRIILATFLASMIGRAAIELPLIYVVFGWTPMYGIAHDLFNIGLIAAFRIAFKDRLDRLSDSFNLGVRRFCTTIQGALIAEIIFAALFYRMRVHQDAVYFAPPTEAFRHINVLTRWVDVAVYTDLGLFLWRQRLRLFWGLTRS